MFLKISNERLDMSHTITDFILSKTSRLSRQPEITPGAAEQGWEMMNDAGVELPIAELLYTLTRVFKPSTVFETGTHKGVSSAYLAQGLEDNGKGILHTCEILSPHYNDALLLWKDLGLSHRIKLHRSESLKVDFPADTKLDMVLLDSEPQLRQDEFCKYFDLVSPGGIIVIHDLNGKMGKTGLSYSDRVPSTDWPWGPFENTIGKYIKNFDIQSISLPCPRGCMLFQKRAEDFNFSNLLLGKDMVI